MHRAFVLFFLTIPIVSSGQNLVPNGGFEEYFSCPGYFSERISEFKARSWTSAGAGTPDLFNVCSEGEADVPYNWAGVSDAFEGNGFAGIFLWIEGDNNYREYLQCRLTDTLRKDSVYHIEFHYRLSSYSKFAIDRVGLILGDTIFKFTSDQVIRVTPTFSVMQDSALTTETGLWETAVMLYKARGGERYLVIGNFFDNDQTRSYCIQSRPIQEEMLAHSAYYYIDNVQVISTGRRATEMPAEPERDVNYTLNTVQFEFDSYKLTPASYTELDELAIRIQRNSSLNVLLSGHTDDRGSTSYNDTLSLDRAVAVLEYLVGRGIDRKRMRAIGFGKRKPLINDHSENGCAANRRVEVKFIQ